MRVQFPELPGGLAPQALLESAELEVMLSRSDARDNRALAKLVNLAQRELERLIERQLEVACPLPWWSRLRGWVADRIRGLSTLRPVDVVGLAMVVGVLIAAAWRGGGSGSAVIAPPERPPQVVARTAPPPSPAPGPRPFEDLRRRYRGPEVDDLAPRRTEPIALRYRPADGQPYFAALAFSRLSPDGSPVPEEIDERLESYPTSSCEASNCLDVEVQIESAGPILRIPVPTGHRLVTDSLAMEGAKPRLGASAEGQPVLAFDGPVRGLLRYRTTATVDPTESKAPRAPATLPARFERRANQLRALPVPIRVAVLQDLVRERVAYDYSAPIARRHRQLRARGDGFIRRTLAIGAGDCDVQNSLLTALLHAAGVPARLAVGYQGVQGKVLPSLHAWVEYRDSDGRWSVADASASSADAAELVATAPAADPEGDELDAGRAAPAPGAAESPPIAVERALPTPAPPGPLPRPPPRGAGSTAGLSDSSAPSSWCWPAGLSSDARAARSSSTPAPICPSCSRVFSSSRRPSATSALCFIARSCPWRTASRSA